MDRAGRPIVYMAFANPTGDLIGIQKEIGSIKDIFFNVDGLLELQIDQRVELQSIRKSFQRFRDRVVLLHFAGHAESTSLLFESPDGKQQKLGADSLARFLATQESLDVVFLNGCQTQDQTTALIDAGVKCVIATTEKIEDAAAIRFATGFYEALTTGATLEKAYAEASAYTQFDGESTTRALYAGPPPIKSDWSDELPWAIRYSEDVVKDWSLMRLAKLAQAEARRASMSPEDQKQQQQLGLLLDKVKSFWVGGVFDRTASDGLLPISKETRPDAINQPWEGLKVSPNQESEVLGATESLSDVLESVGGRLLILGQPGSGKTTTLLQLTQELIRKSEEDHTKAIPVIFHLSSFTDPEQPFATWLECELLDKYQIPRRIGQEWIEQERLILLLDGLDEVLPHCRQQCVHAIHEFMATGLSQSICVCSRIQEYEALGIKLELNGAICLQPLTKQQILEFVDQGGPEMETLKEILNQHEPLQELAQSPLMLNIMSQAYGGLEAEELTGEQFQSLEGYRGHLFDSYIDKMFESPAAKNPPFDREETVGRLSWLARKIDTDSGSALVQLEDLQPHWLNRAGHSVIYFALLAVALALVCTVFTSVCWYGLGMISPDSLKGFLGEKANDTWELVKSGQGGSRSAVAWQALTGGYPAYALLMFLAWFGLLTVIEPRVPRFSLHRSSVLWEQFTQGLFKSVASMCVWYLLCRLLVPVGGNEVTGNSLDDIMIFTGLCASLVLGFYGNQMRCFSEIRSVETVGLSWMGAIRGGLFGALVGFGFVLYAWSAWAAEPNLVFFFVPTESVQYSVKTLDNGLKSEVFQPCHGNEIFGLAFVLTGTVLGVLFGARIPQVLDQKTLPNQGMRLSLRNGIASFLICFSAVFATVMFCILIQNLDAKKLLDGREALTYLDAFKTSMGCGIAAAFCAAMWFGGFDVLKHALLRFVLAAFGYLPLQIPLLLDHAAKLDFMNRVGGGYIFSHRLLMDHFAELNDDTALLTRE